MVIKISQAFIKNIFAVVLGAVLRSARADLLLENEKVLF
jgi:hypothetical protein